MMQMLLTIYFDFSRLLSTQQRRFIRKYKMASLTSQMRCGSFYKYLVDTECCMHVGYTVDSGKFSLLKNLNFVTVQQ